MDLLYISWNVSTSTSRADSLNAWICYISPGMYISASRADPLNAWICYSEASPGMYLLAVAGHECMNLLAKGLLKCI